MTETNPKRRWFRFSLRALLVVVTAAAVWMGVTMKNIRNRREAIRAVDEVGGTYGIRTVGPKWLRTLVGDEKGFYDATRISLGPGNQGYDPKRPVTDGDVARIVDHLGAFSNFTQLHLWDPHITDEAMLNVVKLAGLKVLYLNGTSISDKGIACLEQMNSLKKVDLTRTHVTAEGTDRLQRALPNCEISGP